MFVSKQQLLLVDNRKVSVTVSVFTTVSLTTICYYRMQCYLYSNLKRFVQYNYIDNKTIYFPAKNIEFFVKFQNLFAL